MGIKGLSKLIADLAPAAVCEREIKSFFRRKVAIDASMCIYQFMIAIRTGPSSSSAGGVLTNENGETTSHLNGMFYRTIRMMSSGIKPVFVFDGKPPSMKGDELNKRRERRVEATTALEAAKEADDHVETAKFQRRTVRVSKRENDECKTLLRLMGVPIVEAPCEAEAQCAELCKQGVVYATATEDMDALTFGTPILLRHLTYSEARKMSINEFRLDDVLEGLQISMDQFRDLCILCGCDYTSSIFGIGPKKALNLIKKHITIEEVIKNINTDKFKIPDTFNFEDSRRLFHSPEVTSGKSIELQWTEPDEEGLRKFLVENAGFNAERVKSGISRLKDAKKKGTQGRLEDFFGASTLIKRKKTTSATKGKKTSTKKMKTKL